jgi:hypothetical protein
MQKKSIILLFLLLLFACSVDPGPEEGQRYKGMIGGWYKSIDLKRLSDPEMLEDLQKTWDADSKRGSSWSAQYEGFITAPATEKVVMFARSNQEIVFSIAGKEVLQTGKGSETDSAEISMKKGHPYPLHLVYRQRKSKSQSGHKAPYLQISWRWKGSERQAVPSEALHYTQDQNVRWNYIGENYHFPFSYTDTVDYALDPIRIIAPELAKLDFSQFTGGLPVVPGVETYTICPANREHPEKAEGLGYTYQHHQDLAIWKGRMYAGWNTCQVDEDTYPSREMISTSLDGKTWSMPVEMFPQGISTPLRMYFYLAPNGTMLVIAGLREDHEPLTERRKGGLVVRQIHPDHSLGKVYTLRNVKEAKPHQPPGFESSPEEGFVEACRQLLADKLYLSQQDYGYLLDPDDRMEWFNPEDWEGSEQLKDMASEFGKAMCFFERKDGTLVTLSKFRWVSTSADGGLTWEQPVRPKSLNTGWGKLWAQGTSDGRYVLIYNPHPINRWPLLLLTSDDGISFSNPMSVNGPLPERRYEGKYKDIGVSYHRGLSHWNNDGTWIDDDVWLVYSLNKEDIRISRIRMPLPG